MSSKSAAILLKGYLGDAVLTTPMLSEVGRFFERVWVVTEPGVIEILSDTFPKYTFLQSRKLSKPTEFLKQSRELRALRPDVAIVVNRSFRTALVSRVAGIRQRVGHATEGRGWLLTKAIPYDLHRPEVECYLDLLRALELPAESHAPRLEVPSSCVDHGVEILEGATIGVQPGARYEGKQWPIDRMAALVQEVLARGHKVVMLGGREEQESARALQSKVKGPLVDLAGKCSLKEVMGVLKNLRLTVGSDTGLMHIAAGVGCPTVTIFGPNPAEKWAHKEPPHQALQAPESQMSAVTSEEVLAACKRAFPEL